MKLAGLAAFVAYIMFLVVFIQCDDTDSKSDKCHTKTVEHFLTIGKIENGRHMKKVKNQYFFQYIFLALIVYFNAYAIFYFDLNQSPHI